MNITNTTQHLCPIDGTPLVKVNKNGVEIEYCPTCGGVWLDHGELEKLIALASTPKFGPPDVSPSHQPSSQPSYPSQSNPGYHNNDHKGYHHKKKKDNWLGDMFDF